MVLSHERHQNFLTLKESKKVSSLFQYRNNIQKIFSLVINRKTNLLGKRNLSWIILNQVNSYRWKHFWSVLNPYSGVWAALFTPLTHYCVYWEFVRQKRNVCDPSGLNIMSYSRYRFSHCTVYININVYLLILWCSSQSSQKCVGGNAMLPSIPVTQLLWSASPQCVLAFLGRCMSGYSTGHSVHS